MEEKTAFQRADRVRNILTKTAWKLEGIKGTMFTDEPPCMSQAEWHGLGFLIEQLAEDIKVNAELITDAKEAPGGEVMKTEASGKVSRAVGRGMTREEALDACSKAAAELKVMRIAFAVQVDTIRSLESWIKSLAETQIRDAKDINSQLRCIEARILQLERENIVLEHEEADAAWDERAKARSRERWQVFADETKAAARRRKRSDDGLTGEFRAFLEKEHSKPEEARL